MKTILQTLAVVGVFNFLSSCTAYIDPHVDAPATTTTTTTTEESPFLPGARVTTEQTTTRH